ncbi:PREDICTED: putative glutathione-specific gamma-glutamylcyclotransferase 2 [Drosophila arizonae]|uniref:glutathione-specific gamma-glutamylcyclotransferase n=1 Tax=Drosophila arizonae TaxID=7263 RepID=A0ABM1PSJ1_DROAR|nr:PREDICTED: putative glutathione-specific gamma-glutamylcyclotransferase 2 [Drosophila arizonae]
MLRLVQGLRLSSNSNSNELSTKAAEIYRECFAELAASSCPLTQHKCNSNSNGQHSTLLQCFDAKPSNQTESIAPSPDDVWIFGYGSLVWKADFPYIDRRRGFVCGYKRRFYQHSIDHRGIPERPGRVVTLLPGDLTQDRVYGVAYRIAAAQKSQVLDHLDYREKNGYERYNLEFHEYPSTTMPIEVIIYVATQSNDSYAGHVWQVPCIARQIFTSAGPSGPNREYLFNLFIAMQELFPDVVDEHLTELVDCVKQYIKNEEPALLEQALKAQINCILSEFLAKDASEQQQEAIAQRLEALLERCQRPGWREELLIQELQERTI